jgi:hypothetical protein
VHVRSKGTNQRDKAVGPKNVQIKEIQPYQIKMSVASGREISFSFLFSFFFIIHPWSKKCSPFSF